PSTAAAAAAAAASSPKLRIVLAPPAAAIAALLLHLAISGRQSDLETSIFLYFLGIVAACAFAAAIFLYLLGIVAAAFGWAAAILQSFLPALRRWMAHTCPILAGAIGLVAFWDVITTGFHLLPMPYFPGPAAV